MDDKRIQVGVRELRENLRHWLERAKAGESFVVTERGRPIARISGVERSPALERLIAAGIVKPARRRRRRVDDSDLVEAKGNVSELVSEQRR